MAHILGVMTQKGMNTEFAMDLQEKAGINYAANAGDIDQEVSMQIDITYIVKKLMFMDAVI